MDLEVGGQGAGVPNPFAGPHPLLIPGVLENVFEYCGFKELTACRLVSKDWHENSLKRWRSLAKVKLVEGADCRQPIRRFMNFVETEEKKNGSFKQYSGHFVIGGVRNLDPFLKGYGLQISALELKNVTFESIGELRKVIFQSCPNMKELTLLNPIKVVNAPRNISEPREWVEPQFGENFNLKRLTLPRSTKSFGITRMEILSHFPALEVLIQKERNPQGQSWYLADYYKLFDVVWIIRRHDPNKLPLKVIQDLEIVKPVNTSALYFPYVLLLIISHQPKLSVEHLAVILDGRVEDAQYILILRAILLYQKETLRKLELFRTPGENYLNPCFVFQNYNCPKNLEELTLRSRVFSNPCFLKSMPNLKKLTICGMEDEIGRHDNIFEGNCSFWCSSMRSLVLENCTELHLAFRLDKEDLEKVVRIFPNVEKVTISLDNEMFAVVCENWKNLVELNIFDSSLDDAGITGLDAEEVICVNQTRSLPMRREARDTTPNISFLTHLRRVSISNWEEFPITMSLGHASATFGFQRVPCLQYLHITNYNMEEDVKEAMRNSATSCVFTYDQSDRATLLEGLRTSLF